MHKRIINYLDSEGYSDTPQLTDVLCRIVNDAYNKQNIVINSGGKNNCRNIPN